MKILMVGNSFSQDTMALLPAAAASAGVEVLGCNLFIGGCPLSRHVDLLKTGDAAYIFEIYGADLSQRGTHKTNLADALARHEWDIITFQQASPTSGQAESYDLVDELYAFVKERMGDRPVRYAWNMTWAYQKDYNNEKFDLYNRDQDTMYRAICHAVDTKIRPRGLDVIPCGVAIQNARALLGDRLTIDGMHLSRPLGRYIAALTFLARLLDIAPERVTFVPEGVTEAEVAACRAAVTAAVAQELSRTSN